MERRIKNNPEVKRRLSSLELDAAFRDIALAVRGANSEMIRDLSAAFSFLRHPKESQVAEAFDAEEKTESFVSMMKTLMRKAKFTEIAGIGKGKAATETEASRH